MRCCLMVLLLKCLVTVFLNPQPLYLPKYVLNLHSNSAPPKFPIRPHRVHPRLSHCQNPNKSDPPKWISIPPRWPCQLSVIICIHFGLTELCKSVSPRWLAKSLLPYCFTSVQ